MRTLTDEEIKNIGIEILEAVDLFCAANNLKYILFYGSLLGAIRHDGFIPWDDDIDIAMPRKDYEFFIQHFDSKHYGVKSCFFDKDYFLPWAKAYDKQTIKIEPVRVKKSFEIGFNIDVFPIDSFSSKDNYWNIKKQEYRLINNYTRSSFVYSKRSILKRLYQLLFLKKPNYYSKKIDVFFIKHDKEATKKCLVSNSVFMGVKTRKYVFPKDMFEHRSKHKFESKEFYIPYCFDEVLKTCYGNYLELPPKNQQVTHHNFAAFHKD